MNDFANTVRKGWMKMWLVKSYLKVQMRSVSVCLHVLMPLSLFIMSAVYTKTLSPVPKYWWIKCCFIKQVFFCTQESLAECSCIVSYSVGTLRSRNAAFNVRMSIWIRAALFLRHHPVCLEYQTMLLVCFL